MKASTPLKKKGRALSTLPNNASKFVRDRKRKIGEEESSNDEDHSSQPPSKKTRLNNEHSFSVCRSRSVQVALREAAGPSNIAHPLGWRSLHDSEPYDGSSPAAAAGTRSAASIFYASSYPHGRGVCSGSWSIGYVGSSNEALGTAPHINVEPS